MRDKWIDDITNIELNKMHKTEAFYNHKNPNSHYRLNTLYENYFKSGLLDEHGCKLNIPIKEDSITLKN